MVATPRPLSTENQSLHTQRLTPHIAPLIIPIHARKNKGLGSEVLLYLSRRRGVWIGHPYPALFCCLATGSTAGAGGVSDPLSTEPSRPKLSQTRPPFPRPPPLLTREQKHNKEDNAMKKLLALLLAVTMLAAGSAGAMAAPDPVILLENPDVSGPDRLRPGETLNCVAWLNLEDPEEYGYLTSFEYEAAKKVRSAAVSDPSTMKIRGLSNSGNYDEVNALTPEGKYNGLIEYTIRKQSGSFTVADLSKPPMTNSLIITFEDGTTAEYPVQIEVDDLPMVNGGYFYDKDGNKLKKGQTRLTLNEEYTLTFVVVDKNNQLRTETQWAGHQYVDNGGDAHLQVGTPVKNGNTFRVPVKAVEVGRGTISCLFSGDLMPADIGPKRVMNSYIVRDNGANPPNDPDKPTKPIRPTRPDNPGGGGGPVDDDKPAPQATENKANEEKTQNALKAGNTVEVKLSNGTAAVDLDIMAILGGGRGTLTVINDRMTVDIPGGFGAFHEPGRIYFPFDYEQEPPCCSYEMNAAVKEGNRAKTETVKAGGNMVMPGPVTVTLKTKLTGTVNVYHYNDYNRRFTKLAEVSVVDGRVTFTTRQLGHMVLTTGTI